MNSDPIGILGYGRFGRVMMRLLSPEHDVFFYDVNEALYQETHFKPLLELLKLPTLILAVPIGRLEKLLQQIGPQIKTKTVIDVCSDKIYPTKWMLQYLPKETNIIATHPMFGPDSYESNNKNMMMYPVRISAKLFHLWQAYFTGKNIHISLMTPEQHDKETAFSQNLTHFLGRVLGQLTLQDTEVATVGYKSLLKIVQQTCNDSWELFYDMFHYNPYSELMIEKLNIAKNDIVAKLEGEKTHGE